MSAFTDAPPSRDAPDAYFAVKNPEIMQTTYADLVNPCDPAPAVVIPFTTPTVFRHQGKSVIFAEPQLVFRFLLKRWNAFSPTKIRETLADRFPAILVSAYHLKTRIIPFRQSKLIGFAGFVRYLFPEDFSEHDRRRIRALARFAGFAGVGYKTTMGMGACTFGISDGIPF
ncbi:MAG: CRISPR system precrRNA processing endoribonuclease RAMP protein Cas6 [bacterium JZ-2024 1]